MGILIGFTGKMGSGKTKQASLIADWAIEVRSFALPLKGLANQLLCIPGHIHPDKNQFFPKWGMTYGQFLQWFGTDVVRAKNPDAWVDMAIESAIDDPCCIFDDVRFPNEANAIRSRGGVVIKLVGDPSGIRAASTRDRNHESETAMDDYPCDLELYTLDSTVEETHKKIVDFLHTRYDELF